MPPSQRFADIRILVPRQGAPPVSPALARVIQELAEREGIALDRNLLTQRPAVRAATEAASEWNTLLIGARADRGPQWDILGQRYLVDERSDLYYDPSTLAPEPSPEIPPAEPPPRPMVNGILHHDAPHGADNNIPLDPPPNHINNIHLSPPAEASPAMRYQDTPRRSMRNGPIGRDG